ncbi:MAG: helix-turn-helix transcriptional regulator [Firmicutes bacterium]|nr:helix-turn-helix transcriptional regulator [Bacillota bacterium]
MPEIKPSIKPSDLDNHNQSELNIFQSELSVLGQRIRQLRKPRNWSQATLAELCDVSPSYIGSVERGEKLPSLQVLSKIAKTFSVRIGVLFEVPATPEEKEIDKISIMLRGKPIEDIHYVAEVTELYLRRLAQIRGYDNGLDHGNETGAHAGGAERDSGPATTSPSPGNGEQNGES